MAERREGMDWAGTRRVLRAGFLHSSLFIGLIALAFLLGTYALLDLTPSFPLLVLGFSGAYLVYHFERGLAPAPEDAYNNPARSAWLRRNRGLFWTLAALALAGGIGALPLLRLETLAACGIFGVLSLAYMAPVLPGGRRLKTVWFLKPFLIGVGWALAGVFLPVVEAGAPVTGVVLLLAAQRLCFVLPNALLADWPDREGDARAGLRTVATELSRAGVRRVAVLLLVASLTLSLALALASGRSALYLVDAGGPLLMLAVVLRPLSSHGRAEALLMDGLVAWPGVSALASALWVNV